MSRCRAMIYSISLQARRNITARAPFATANANAHTKFAKSLFFQLDHFEPAHIGLQNVRHCDRSALLLIGLHDRNQRTSYRGTGAVQRVHKMRLPSLPRYRASIRRAWKSPQTEQLEISLKAPPSP